MKNEDKFFNNSIYDEQAAAFSEKQLTDPMKYQEGMEIIDSDIFDKVQTARAAYDYTKYTEADVRAALAHSERTPEDFAALPLTSYGTQKAIDELLLADYTRRGFVDGVGIRLPTGGVNCARSTVRGAASSAAGVEEQAASRAAPARTIRPPFPSAPRRSDANRPGPRPDPSASSSGRGRAAAPVRPDRRK